jgi:uncharacterized membrane protein
LTSIATSRIEPHANDNLRTAWMVWAALFAFCVLLLTAIVGAPIAQAQGHLAFAAGIYKTFSFFCHQIPERSFHIAGHQFAVCSRCTGLYSGFAFATIGYPLFRSLRRTDTPRVIWLFLSALPLAVDFSLTYFGFWQNTHFTRFTTGALFGGVAAIFIVPGLIELTLNVVGRFRTERRTRTRVSRA